MSNMKRVLAAGVGVLSAMAACGGDVVVDHAGSGGAGSTTASTNVSTSVSSTGPGPVTSSSTGFTTSTNVTTSTGNPGCLTCSEMIDQGNSDPGALCGFNGPPSSAELWFNLAKCVCELVCPQCLDNWCVDFQSMTPECSECLGDTAPIVQFCNPQVAECLNDTP
jgi:hypothetical protein